MNRKVIAVDFDDTLFTNNWPGVGEPIWPTIERAKAEQAKGSAIILWTCRIGESLDAAVDACKGVGLIPDAVNETLPEWLEEWVDDPRKIGATEYWDDRAVNVKSPWIPVTERLPEDGQRILVCTATKLVKDARYIKRQNRFLASGNLTVTHWMPVPEVPV